MVAAWRPTEGMTAMPRPTMGPLSPERSASRLQHMCTLSFRRGGGLVDAPGRRGECEVKKPSLSPLSSDVLAHEVASPARPGEGARGALSTDTVPTAARGFVTIDTEGSKDGADPGRDETVP